MHTDRGALAWQADGRYEVAQAEYNAALIAAARHRHKHRATIAFVEERVFQCYVALGDWDALKMQLASPQVLALWNALLNLAFCLIYHGRHSPSAVDKQ